MDLHLHSLDCAWAGRRRHADERVRDARGALLDAMRLSEGMTLKMAGVDVAFGGGKAVLAVPELLVDGDRRGLLLRYRELVDSLGGSYQTGPDMNTSVEDMDVIGERTPYVFCRSLDQGGSGDPGPYPARGAFHGIRDPADAQRLHEARIVCAPDFVINAGGVLHAWRTEGLGWARAGRDTTCRASVTP